MRKYERIPQAVLQEVDPYGEHPPEAQEAAALHLIEQSEQREKKRQEATARLEREIVAEQEYVRACEGVLPYAIDLLNEVGVPLSENWSLVESPRTDDYPLFVESREDGDTGLMGDHFRSWSPETNPNARVSVWLRTRDGVVTPWQNVSVALRAPEGGTTFRFEFDTETESKHHIDANPSHEVRSSEIDFERRGTGKGENGTLEAGISIQYSDGLPWYVTIRESIPWSNGALFKESSEGIVVNEELCHRAQDYLRDHFGYEIDLIEAIQSGQTINPLDSFVATMNALEQGDASGPVIVNNPSQESLIHNSQKAVSALV